MSSIVIEEFVVVTKNTLRGFARVRLPSGLVLHDVAIHQRDGTAWASPASKPMLNRDGQQMKDQNGKLMWLPIISFTSPPDRTGAGKLFAMARDAWPGWQRPSKSRRRTQDPPAIVIRVVNPTELGFAPVPPRIWIVQDWLPIGTVTGNYGDGGTGKTLLSQLLQTSCATCIPWAGQRVLRCKSFGLYCEDAEEELHRRQDDINTVFDQAYSGLGDMRWISGVGDDWNYRQLHSRRRMHTTERWNLLVREVTAFGARLLCLDARAGEFAT